MNTLRLAQLKKNLVSDVLHIAGVIGERHLWNKKAARLQQAALWLRQRFESLGYTVSTQSFIVPQAKFPALEQDFPVENLEIEILGTVEPNKIIIIGAHYDSFPLSKWDSEELPSPTDQGTPGANDNGSGVAAVLALAEYFKASVFKRTVRFVAFVNEEPPFFRTDYMGSRQYARRCRERDEDIILMVTPETIGCYLDKPQPKGSFVDRLAYWVYWLKSGMPSDANHVAFLCDSNSHDMAQWSKSVFAKRVPLPVRAISLSSIKRNIMFSSILSCPPFCWFWGTYERDADHRVRRMPLGVPSQRWSDDASFWEYGYKAFAITDTAYLRYKHYHERSDLPGPSNSEINYDKMAEVVEGMKGIVEELANPPA
jgi:hypothetical protein